MSLPITSVTEGHVTVTANDTEANIRASAGFTEPETKPDTPAKDAPRDDSGRFKAKETKETKESKDAPVETKAEPAAEKPVTDTPEPDEKPTEDIGGDPRKSIQAKINLAIAKQRDAERRAAAIEAEFAAFKAQQQAPAPAAQAPEPSAPAAPTSRIALVQQYQSHPDAPKLDEFMGLEDPYLAHQIAMSAFVVEQREAESAKRAEQTKAQQTEAARIDAMFRAGGERHEQFFELVQADSRTYPNAVLDQFRDPSLDPSLSADLMFHLVTHPDDAAHLAQQTSPIAAAREVGRLLAGLSSALPGPDTAPPVVTNAKPLIKPVRSSVMAPGAAPPEDLPFGPKYIAAMNEQERKARESRRA